MKTQRFRLRALIKRLTPNPVLPFVRMVDSRSHEMRSRIAFSRRKCDKLPALKCKISYNKYGGYCVPLASRHRLASRAVLANDVYEPDTIEFIRTHCGTGDIVHAGAYFGDFFPALANALSPDKYVWSFEPNEENYRCALITIIINDLKNVRLYNAGLDSENGSKVIEVVDESGIALGGASTFLTSTTSETSFLRKVQKITVVAIDNVIPADRNISILQLDVEGYEKQALRGSLETIRRCRPILILEVWDTSELLTGNWFRENILSLGYKWITALHGNEVFVC